MGTEKIEKIPRLGIDVGSKTAKVVLVNEDGGIEHALYRRHRSHVTETAARLVHDLAWRFGNQRASVCMTGSAGIALADTLGVPFVQEVIATETAVRTRYPHASCIVELGGEDAKITYLEEPFEQRMNATCAGGTGDFLDGIASMLGVRTRDLSGLAFGAQRTYPIASRCAVFAQTDVRPLINAGALPADIAQSALDAVVRQTLGGLACGRPIRGTVIFLGGPLHHIPALVVAFRKALGLTRDTGVKPADAHLYPALGCALSAEGAPTFDLLQLEERLRSLGRLEDDAGHLAPLFSTDAEREEFNERHASERVQTIPLDRARPPLFLGFDAGSTTIKYTLVDADGAIVANDYRPSDGDVVATTRAMLEELFAGLSRVHLEEGIARAVVTGYGEDLLRAGFGFDGGVVETIAHVRGARAFRPDASFVLDIGGQDMKALWIEDGRVVDAVLNEACSSGCGAFIESSANALLVHPSEFARLALEAQNPVDLGAKCTVFMTSRVRHAQKIGAKVEDIAAGVAYSVVSNVMTRIIGSSKVASIGGAVVVQGGAFKSDAVLRAFEKAAGVNAVRPSNAHLMGSFGAALVARDEWVRSGSRTVHARSSLIDRAHLNAMNVRRASGRCPGCGNACLVSVVSFGGNRRFVSGNRCERAYEALFGSARESAPKAPNVVAVEQRLISSFNNVRASGPRSAVTVGIMDAMEVYQRLPFWHRLFYELGFSIVVPNRARARRFADSAAETVPSESVCYPAKATHARYASLVDTGADVVFMPRFERGNHCPVASGYAHVLDVNMEASRVLSPVLRCADPNDLARCPHDVECLEQMLAKLTAGGPALAPGELETALAAALGAQREFEQEIESATNKAFAWARAEDRRRVAVLAGRPYHVDPQFTQNIDVELSRLGFAVVPILGLGARLREDDARTATAWDRSATLAGLVQRFARDRNVEIVALRSFGCGYDAVAFDEAGDIARSLARPFTQLKVDEISDTAHMRIRLRTLAYTAREEGSSTRCLRKRITTPSKSCTPDLCSTAKALIDLACDQVVENAFASARLPQTCVRCLTEALPFELRHMLDLAVDVTWDKDLASSAPHDAQAIADAGKPTVGLLGNPLLVFDSKANEGIETLIETLGWQVVYPNPTLLDTDDVRYLEQLKLFRRQHVQRVLYLQSFGCLKGHVHSRGSLRQLASLYPDLPITVIDYDPESSALNRENRVRLALGANRNPSIEDRTTGKD